MNFFKGYISLTFLFLFTAGYGQVINQAECDTLIEKGIDLMFEKKHVQSLELLVQAAALAEDNNWSKQKFRALLNTGSNYYLMSDFGEALDYYLKAYEIAITDLETKDELTVLNNIGILYFQEANLLKAKEYFGKAYNLSFNQENSSKHGYYAINLALVSNKMQQPEEASKYINEALPLVKDQPEVEIMAKMAMAENLFIKGKYKEARELSLLLLPQMTGETNADNRVFMLLLLSKIYKEEKQYYLALQNAKMARAGSRILEHREDVYEALSNAHGSLKEYDKALLYKDSILIARDSLQEKRNNTLYENNKIKFELQKFAHELNESRLLLQKERRFFYSIVIFGVLLLVLLMWIFRIHLIRHKQRKKIAELELEQEKTKRLVAEKQMREQEAIVNLEQERLKNELDLKNRELTTRAMYLASKNELIEEVIQSLSQNLQIAINPSLKNQINDLKKHLRKDTQWDSFFVHFEELNQGFLDRLRTKHSQLSTNDIRFLTFLYMNLSYKEIAALLNITPQSCRKRKERISKKMNVPDNLPLHAYLAAI